MTRGYLYALANPSMPGAFKVGCTSLNPFERAAALRTTGVPAPFEVVLAMLSNDMKVAEANAHLLLSANGSRIDDQREFFRVDFATILDVFTKVADVSQGAGQGGMTFDSDDLFLQAQRFHFGQGLTPPDPKKAVKFYEQAAQAGNMEACRVLRDIYTNGSLARKSKQKAEYYGQRYATSAFEQLRREAAQKLLREQEERARAAQVAREEKQKAARMAIEKNEEVYRNNPIQSAIQAARSGNVKALEFINSHVIKDSNRDDFFRAVIEHANLDIYRSIRTWLETQRLKAPSGIEGLLKQIDNDFESIRLPTHVRGSTLEEAGEILSRHILAFNNYSRLGLLGESVKIQSVPVNRVLQNPTLKARDLISN